jgi:HEAT repeat protein
MKSLSILTLVAALSLSGAVLLTGCKDKAPQVDVAAFTADLKSPDTDKKANACAELAKAGPAAAPAVPDLIELLKDKDPLVRHLAAYTLGQIGPKAASAIPALQEARNDPDRDVMMNAVDALRNLGDASANVVIPNVMTNSPGQ